MWLMLLLVFFHAAIEFYEIISQKKSRSPSTIGFDFPSQAMSSRGIGIIVQSLPNPKLRLSRLDNIHAFLLPSVFLCSPSSLLLPLFIFPLFSRLVMYCESLLSSFSSYEPN